MTEDVSDLEFPEFEEWIKDKQDKTGKSRDDILTEVFMKGGWFAIDETVLGRGYALLDQITPWDIEHPMGTKGEPSKDPRKLMEEYKRLRNEFGPVSAGIEHHKGFTSGGGFVSQIEDLNDSHQQEMKETTDKFSESVYQDDYTVGLEYITDILFDAALVEGASAAEIVYGDTPINFSNFVEKVKERTVTRNGKEVIEKYFEVSEPKWRKFKDGITRLKIIEDAVFRLEPVRDIKSFEVLYWVLDKGTNQEKYLHTWQVLWVTWNARGRHLKGTSIVKSAFTAARLLESIQQNVGVNFARWADRKYFFVCGTEKRPWGKIHTRNFIQDVKQMREKNLSAIPVPAGFDVKEIGGEVFEGNMIINYLLSVIAASMGYPIEFILSAGRPNDRQWLSWVVRYGRNQQNLKRIIETQLWRRHLWCLYGKEHGVPKQGVSEENREKHGTYVPKLVWRAEGKWAKDTKIKTLKLLGDMANPASAVLHLRMQKDMAETLGYGSLDWKSTEELIKIQEQIKVLEAKRELLKVKALLKRDEVLGEDKLAKKVEEAEKAKAMVPQAPVPKVTTEEELKERQTKRLEKGVSRATRGKGSQKGKSRPMGGPRKVEETINKWKDKAETKMLKEKEELIKKIKDKLEEIE